MALIAAEKLRRNPFNNYALNELILCIFRMSATLECSQIKEIYKFSEDFSLEIIPILESIKKDYGADYSLDYFVN